MADVTLTMHPARRAHLERVAASRAKLEAFNAKVKQNRLRGLKKALQRSAARFLPPGTEIDPPRVLDLSRWPYVGLQRIDRDVPQAVRDSVLEADTVCVWCREAPSTTIDHVHPLCRGGSNNPLNLVGACEPCNSAKGDFLPTELGWVLRLPRRAFVLGAERPEAAGKSPEK